MTSLTQNLKPHHKAKGFTLIELIVVVAIIASLLAVGVGVIKNTAASKGVDTGTSIAEGLFYQARQMAKARGHEIGVAIYADTTGSNKDRRSRFLRYMAIVIPEVNATTKEVNLEEWRLQSSGLNLPNNTYFNATLSELDASEQKRCLFPGSSTKKKCYIYIFNSSGSLQYPTDNGKFVIQIGSLKPGATAPTKLPSNAKDAGGFRIWKNGRTSTYKSISQVKSSGELDF